MDFRRGLQAQLDQRNYLQKMRPLAIDYALADLTMVNVQASTAPLDEPPTSKRTSHGPGPLPVHFKSIQIQSVQSYSKTKNLDLEAATHPQPFSNFLELDRKVIGLVLSIYSV